MTDQYDDAPTLAQVRQMFTQLVGNPWPFGADLYEIVQIAVDGNVAMQSSEHRVPGIWLVHRSRLIVDKRHAEPLRAASIPGGLAHLQLHRTHALPRLFLARYIADSKLRHHDAWTLAEDSRGSSEQRTGSVGSAGAWYTARSTK